MKRYPVVIGAVVAMAFAVLSAPPASYAELDIETCAVSAGPPVGLHPGPHKKPPLTPAEATARFDERIQKARKKAERVARGMFPKELQEMAFKQRISAEGQWDPRAYLRAKESLVLLEKQLKGVP